jgi:NAD(P)-dependent dehydrogenase (short-subunit alcohol dehydrogenase family)
LSDLELCYLSATEALAAFRKRSLSPVELLNAQLERIAAVGSDINAFSFLYADEATAAAKEAERRYRSGTNVRPLEGIPVAIKDESLIAGKITTFGSLIFQNEVASVTSPVVDVNVKGLLNTTAAVLPQMIKQHSGHVFNMSSIAGRKVFKGLSVHCATKHAVTAFSDGLRMEVGQKHGIRVTCIQPGAVATELYDHITDPGYRKQMDELASQMTFLQAEGIGDSIVFAAQAPAHVDVDELFVLPVEQGW